MGLVRMSLQGLWRTLTPLPRAQGNGARATQLKWQRERNEQLARNYKKELEEKQKQKQGEVISSSEAASDSNLFQVLLKSLLCPCGFPVSIDASRCHGSPQGVSLAVLDPTPNKCGIIPASTSHGATHLRTDLR